MEAEGQHTLTPGVHRVGDTLEGRLSQLECRHFTDMFVITAELQPYFKMMLQHNDTYEVRYLQLTGGKVMIN